MSTPELPLLSVRELSTSFPIRSSLLKREVGRHHAVKHVSFDLAAGKTLGLVGESGSGKTTLARTIVGLLPPSGGTVNFDGTDLTTATPKEFRHIRRSMQMVFQDPYSSLNPRLTVSEIITEAWRIQRGLVDPARWDAGITSLLDRVGLDPGHADRYPHQFSGGQRQRIGIARALALRPKLIICDEAVSALDVSVQAQILNLLDDLQKELGIAYLFIAHDLSVVRHIADEVLVMYLGEKVEHGPATSVFDDPQHEYTRSLLSAAPVVRPWARSPS